jgi:hypothetical protein
MAAPSSVKNRARSIAHRWGPITVVNKDGPELAAIAIRYDEEDRDTAETFLLRMGPGRAEAVDGMLGAALGVACSSSGVLFVLDAKNVVHAAGKRHKLMGARAIAVVGDEIVVAGDQKLWRFDATGERVQPGPALRARVLSSSNAGLLAALDDGTLALVRGELVTPVPVKDAGGAFTAIHIDDDGRVMAAAGTRVLAGDVSGVKPCATASFEVDAVATFCGRQFVGSRLTGLWVIEDGVVTKLRPSVRAHHIETRSGLLVAAAPLCMATSDDGVDFLTRDLAPFVRIADTRMPRFLQSEDPVV